MHDMITNEDASQSFRAWAFETCQPINGTIELSQNCNLKCKHCYNFDRSSDKKNNYSENELTDTEILGSIKSLREMGCLYVSFTGGEPLLHPKIYDFCNYARELGLVVRLKTNGTPLTEKVCQKLRQIGVSEMDVSLYGSKSSTHEYITNIKNSFEKTIQGVKNAKAHGLYPKFSIILYKDNINELQDMIQIARDLNVGHNISFEMTPRYDGTQSSVDLRATPKQIEKIYKTVLKESVPFLKKEKDDMRCGCARTNLAIAANGDVYPCIGAPIKAGNIRIENLKDIWQNSATFKKIRGLEVQDHKTCKDCSLRNYCPRSPGAAYIATGDYTAADPGVCEIAGVFKNLSL